MRIPASRLTALLLAASALAAACTVEPDGPVQVRRPKPNWDEYEEDFGAYPPTVKPEPPAPAFIDGDSGAFVVAGERPSGGDAAVPPEEDAGPPEDGGTRLYCATPLVAGDLRIVEIMVASRTGSLDEAEWVEVESRRDCWLKADGVMVESPRGAAASNIATLPVGSEIAPLGRFVAAGTSDPTKNHNLKGLVASFQSSDVLKNDGDIVRVKLGALVIDELTYPRFANLTPGRSLAFPSNCKPEERSNFARWSLTFRDYDVGFKGTPNAANTDVTCF